MLNKVPAVTIYFWVIKILCTTVGETAADYLNGALHIGLTGTSVIMSALLAIVIVFQFKAKQYVPFIYWSTVVLISIVGTLITDNLTDKLSVPLETTTIVFSILLSIAFMIWYVQEKTLSVYSINTLRRETFYWLVVLFTFALGTAAGDLTAEKFEIGYLKSIFIFGSIALTAIIYYKMNSTMGHEHEPVHAVLLFWIAYIFTRPLGASIGDYLSQSYSDGGLGVGATATTMLFLGIILGLMVYLTIKQKKDIRLNPLVMVGGSLFILIAVAFLILSKPSFNLKRSVTVQQQKVTAPLGDLTPFIIIAEDSLRFVEANDFLSAKARIKDLEVAWDQAQKRLQRMSPDDWASIDGAIDRVLSKLRASQPDANACKNVLKSFISKSKSLSSS